MPGKITSLAVEDFGTGRWDGGRATITEAYFMYRSAEGKKGKFTVIEAHVVWEGKDGPHDVPYYAGDAQYAVIRANADEDSEEVTKGFAISGREDGATFKVRGDSDFGMLLSSMNVQGFSSRKMAPGDIRAMVGMDATCAAKARNEGDKYPIPLVVEIHKMPKGAAAAAVASDDEDKPKRRRATSSDDDDEQPRKKKPSTVDDDDETPGKRRAREAADDAMPSKSIQNRAAKMIAKVQADADEDVTIAEVISKTKKLLKDDDDAKEIINLWSNDDWLESREEFGYNAKKGVIKAA